ncbi:hypothetical protein IJ818_06485 [bacterium]|nr:hypothetical protein [bacterium]
MISVGNPALSPTMPAGKKKDSEKKASQTIGASNPSVQGYKRITGGQIKDILATPQVTRSDCYLVSTLKALAKSRLGKQMLKDSIKTSADGDTFEVTFNKYDKDNTYKVKKDEKYDTVTSRHQFNPTGAVETATNFVIQDRKDSKPGIIRTFAPLFCADSPVECNLASVYMETLTGRKPVALGDDSLLSLNSKKDEAVKLLDKIGEIPMNKHSFVAGSKLMNTKDGIGKMHYYVIKKVDKDNKEVHLVNPRYVDLTKGTAEKDFVTDLKNDGYSDKDIQKSKDKVNDMPKVYKLSYEQFMDNFRSIVGYFDDKVSKKH